MKPVTTNLKETYELPYATCVEAFRQFLENQFSRKISSEQISVLFITDESGDEVEGARISIETPVDPGLLKVPVPPDYFKSARSVKLRRSK
jgi:hypothetical protein